MNLVIDIGNSRIKMGLFQGESLLEHQMVTDWSWEALQQYSNQASVRRVMLSSVAEENIGYRKNWKQNFDYQELTHLTPLPFINQYATPETLGKDRLAAVAGAHALFPRQNCGVIDAGTCLKYDWINAEGEYSGGNIAPGLQMRAKAMHQFTAKLPEVTPLVPEHFIGTSTETALQNGAFLGAVLEIEGFMRLFKAAFNDIQWVLTGGDAAFLTPQLPSENLHVEPHLTLYGLNHILNHLQPAQERLV